MTTTPASNDLPLATLTEGGTAPAHRLTSATEAQDLFWTLHDSAMPRLNMARVIQGCLDGNPPYPAQKLRGNATAWRSNFNSLEAASRKESAKTPFYDLFSSAPQYADCATSISGQMIDASTATRIRSAHFDTLLRSYNAFDSTINLMLDDFIAFNKGFLWWPRPDSWHFEHLPWWRVYFPDGTSTNPDTWECFAIEHRWEVGKLWRFVRDPRAAKAAGWNVAQVHKAIREAAPENLSDAWQQPMELQRAFASQELWLSARLPRVSAASIYVKEFDGTWTRIMVETAREGDPRGTGSALSRVERESKRASSQDKRGRGDYLYFKPKVADNLWQILCPFIFEAGAGSMNELGGIGKRIFAISQAKDRLLNEMMNNAMMQTTLVLQAQSAGARAKSASVQLGGGVSVLPEGYAVQNGSIFGNIEGSLVVNQDLDNRLDRNTGIFRPQFEKPRGNPETAAAANIRYAQATVLTNSAVNRFYGQLDKFYTELYRRATLPDLPRTSTDPGVKAAVKFQEDCAESGLTKQQCYDLEPASIRAVRAIGNGSPVQRQQEAAALAQLVPFLGPRGMQAWKVMFAAAHGGQTVVERLLPVEDTAQVPSRDDWDASQENADMLQGNQVVFAPWQNSEIHAQSHLAAAFAAVQSVQQGADPAGPFTFLQVAMPHIAQHIGAVAREQIRKELEAAYAQVAQGAKMVYQAAEEAVKQQGQQQQLSFEQQVELKKVQHEIAIKDQKTQAQMQQRAQKQQFDMQLEAQRFEQEAIAKAQEAALRDASTASEITRATAQTSAAISDAKRKTAAEIESQRLKAEAQAEAAKEKAASAKKGDS